MEYNQHVLVSHYTVTYTLCIHIFTGTTISKLRVQHGSSEQTLKKRRLIICKPTQMQAALMTPGLLSIFGFTLQLFTKTPFIFSCLHDMRVLAKWEML